MAIVMLVSKANDLVVLALGILVFFILVSQKKPQDVGLSGCVQCFLSVSNGMILNFNSLYYREQPVQFNCFFSFVWDA